MSTLSDALSEIYGIKDVIKHIYWSNSGLDNEKDFNYSIDPKAVKNVIQSGLPLTAVNNSDTTVLYDRNLIADIKGINTDYAKKLAGFLESETAGNHSFSFRLADDAIPVLLHYPDLFQIKNTGQASEAFPGESAVIREKIAKILTGETVDRNQVIREFPSDPSFYFRDIEPSVTEIISKYGSDEWASGVLANELHRHLGVFAIVGVKMGIRAREYFATGVDEFMVTSEAGSVPPLSCMNDGLQVSTGATPGHGLLTVKNDAPVPVAEFTYMNQKIRLTLKPEIASAISNELKEINFIYGLDSDTYWELVRKNSIKYWLKLDRHDIFIIEKL
jgi:pyrimidine-specific ribonucleoside hydrolase